MTKATVHIVEDDAALARAMSGIIGMLDYETRLYKNANEFIEGYQEGHPQCLLLDVRMPQMSGIELQQYLSHHNYHIPIIFVSGHADVEMAVGCVQSGAIDFLTKPVNQQRLVDAVNKAIRNDISQHKFLQERDNMNKRLDNLSKREREILQCMLKGKLSKAISIELGISSNTVDNHRANILQKLDVPNISTLMRELCRLELLTSAQSQ